MPISPYYQDDLVTIYNGDSRLVLPELQEPFDLVLTDPPYSTGRSEDEFAASGNVAVVLHLASEKAPTMAVFGTSSGRGINFITSSIRSLPHCRVLVWRRRYVNSPAAGPWRWDTVFIHMFGKAAFGRPQESALIETDGTRKLAISTGHKAPVPTEVMEWIAKPFSGAILDPFVGSGSSLLAARRLGRPAVGVEANERYCEIAASRALAALAEDLRSD